MAREPKAPTLLATRFRLLLEQLVAEEVSESGELGAQTRVAKKLGLAQPHVSMHLAGTRRASSQTIEPARAKLGLRWEFFTEPDLPASAHYRDFLEKKRRELGEAPSIPESFKLWRETSAPAGLTPEIERRMLGTHFDFPTDQAHRWSTVYDLVVADMDGRRAATHGDRKRNGVVVEPGSRVRRRGR